MTKLYTLGMSQMTELPDGHPAKVVDAAYQMVRAYQELDRAKYVLREQLRGMCRTSPESETQLAKTLKISPHELGQILGNKSLGKVSYLEMAIKLMGLRADDGD